MSNGDDDGDHAEHEDHPWTRRIPDHPPRSETPTYRDARDRMNEIAEALPDFFYGPPDYEDHHGGGLWLKDEEGWFLVRNVVGIEWSAQFCADPVKVDRLRMNARRLYDRFPEAVEELGIRELLDTPIQDADDVARWTDAICNASVPLPEGPHRGVLPRAGGIHHYPAPVAEIAFFKFDDFDLWIEDDEGNEVAVVPVARRGSGDGRVRVLHVDLAPSRVPGLVAEAEAEEPEDLILPADSPIARRAFAEQYRKLAAGEVDADDPLIAGFTPPPA